VAAAFLGTRGWLSQNRRLQRPPSGACFSVEPRGRRAITEGLAGPRVQFAHHGLDVFDDSRLQPDTPSEQFAFTTSHNVEPDASDPGHHVEISCQPNSTSAQIDASPPETSSPSAGMTHGLSDATRILREVQHPVVVVCVEDFLDKIAQPGGLSASP